MLLTRRKSILSLALFITACHFGMQNVALAGPSRFHEPVSNIPGLLLTQPPLEDLIYDNTGCPAGTIRDATAATLNYNDFKAVQDVSGPLTYPDFPDIYRYKAFCPVLLTIAPEKNTQYRIKAVEASGDANLVGIQGDVDLDVIYAQVSDTYPGRTLRTFTGGNFLGAFSFSNLKEPVVTSWSPCGANTADFYLTVKANFHHKEYVNAYVSIRTVQLFWEKQTCNP